MRPIITVVLLVAALLMAADATAQQVSTPDYLHVWGTAVDTMAAPNARPSRRGVVLLTFDLRAGAPRRGRLVNAILTDTAGRSAHHTEHGLTTDNILFANDFGSGRTYRFDLSAPGKPRLLGNFTTAGPFARPHSYVQLPNGNMLVTYQGQTGNRPPGGVAEIRRDGSAVRWAHAVAPGIDSTHIQPYSLEIIPALDRAVTTSTSMVSDVGVHVQVWRLSDLSLLHTLEVPRAPAQHTHDAGSNHAANDTVHHMFPGEPRLLADGKTIMLGTFTCGLYVLHGLDTQAPALKYVHSFPGENCAVPVQIGKWWIQTVPASNALIALDVSDPMRPREASRLVFPNEVTPHWMAMDNTGTHLLMNSGSPNDPRVHLIQFDRATGRLTLNSDIAAIDLRNIVVPQLGTVRIEPHGTVFQ